MSNQSVFVALVQKCAERGERLVQQHAVCGDVRAMRLFYKPSSGKTPGDLLLLAVGVPSPQGYQLGCDDEMKGNIPYDRYFQWVYERSTRLPVLPQVH